MKEYILKEFKIPENVTKCCSTCMIRIRKCIRLQRHIVLFGEEEFYKMKKVISDHGLNWKILSETFNKPVNVVKLFFMLNKKKLELDDYEREYSYNCDVNLINFSEDDSDVSGTSSEERETISSDTASAESPKTSNNTIKTKYMIEDSDKVKASVEDDILIPPLNQPPKRQKTQEEYDSSATETADEENEVTTINQHSPKSVQYPFKPINETDDKSVRDIVGKVIEKALKEQSTAPPLIKGATIHENYGEHHMKRENFHLISAKPESALLNPQSMLKVNSYLANVSTSSGQGPPNSMKMPLNCNIINIDMRHETPNQLNIPAFGKNEVDAHTLDLSVKKSTKDLHQPQMVGYQTYVKSEDFKHSEPNQPSILPSQSSMSTYHTFEQAEKLKMNQTQQPYYTSNSISENSSNNSNAVGSNNCNSNSNIGNIRNQPPPPPPPHTVFSQQKPKVMSKQSSKPMHHSQLNVTKGSITQGIPASNSQVVNANIMQARYENIFRQTISSNEKSGSITHGTPMSMGSSPQTNVDKRAFDFYSNKSRMSPSNPQQMSPQSSANFSSPSFNRASYVEHPPLSSKQIIMNDYITSQQMIGQHRSSRIEKESSSPRNMSNISLASSSMYYSDKDRARSEFVNRASPADHSK